MSDSTEVRTIWQWFCPQIFSFNLWIVISFRYGRGYIGIATKTAKQINNYMWSVGDWQGII